MKMSMNSVALILYFQSDMMELAVGAAHTYLLYYPEHETMKNNVQYYRTMDNVQESYFKDLHAKKYQVRLSY